MSLLIFIFLINTIEAKPLADADSLEVKTIETTSEGEDEVLEYSFGMDAYRAGFNKGSISTNTLEEQINTSNGNLELKIKLLSLPMRGNKDYDLYLTYRGSPLSLPGIKVMHNIKSCTHRAYVWYGYDVGGKGNVRDSIFVGGTNTNYIVTSDMGNCGLGWNVMPGELSCNLLWSLVSGTTCQTERTEGFVPLNGEKYSVYDPYYIPGDDWFISGKRNWNDHV